MPGLTWSRDRGIVPRLASLIGVMLILFGTLPVVGAPVALGADTALKAPDTTAAPNGWTDGANATDNTDDGVYATATGDNVDQGYRDFGFSLPHGTIVDGITVKANAFSSDSQRLPAGRPPLLEQRRELHQSQEP